MNEVQVNSQGNVQSVDFTSQEPMQPQRSSQTEMMVTRQAQEVQVAMLAAKKFPRDQVVAYNNIMRACQRRKLAESSMYEFQRGNGKITGPSIRLAEAIAQNWGNIDFGFMELEQRNGASQVMAYAWDLETNSRQTKLFSVPHIRHTKKGDYPLTDPRDIYEAVANQAARRVRACILGIIPSDVVEAAVQAVKTVYPVAGDSGNAGIYPIISTELQTAGGDVLPKVKTESWKVVYPICGDALGI